MFWAFHRIQEAGNLLRARHNGELLRLPAGWDIVFDNPRPFEGDRVDKPECGHGDRRSDANVSRAVVFSPGVMRTRSRSVSSNPSMRTRPPSTPSACVARKSSSTRG